MDHYTAVVVVVHPQHRTGVVEAQTGLALGCSMDSAVVGTEFDFLDFQICF